MKCSPQSKLTSEELENAVAKLRVPLNRLHHDGMGGVVVGPERPRQKGERLLLSMIQITDSCWLWTSRKSSDGYGYGRFRCDGKSLIATRVVYSLVFGLKPDLLVCHDCDNPPCVNPYHLYLGTQKDNNDDCNSRGRRNQMFGDNHAMAKLTEPDVREIIRPYGEGEPSTELATVYGVSVAAVCNIINGKSWRHLDRHDGVVTRRNSIRLTTQDVDAIRQSSEFNRVLAARYGVGATLIHKIKHGKQVKVIDA